jgi:hypothetical protein
MTHPAASRDGRSCRNLPAGSGFLGRGGAYNIPVPVEPHPPAALLKPVYLQVEKLACVSVLRLPFVSMKQGKALRSRCQSHIQQLFDRLRIFPS